jgi:hypothetical protein
MTDPIDASTVPASLPSNLALRRALLTEEQTRTEIMEAIEHIAVALERSAASLRREMASTSEVATKVERVQHEVAWLVPNLGAHQLTHAVIAWTTAKQVVTRLLTEGIEPA